MSIQANRVIGLNRLDMDELVSLYRRVRRDLKDDEKSFVYDPSWNIQGQIDLGRAKLFGIKNNESELIAASVIAIPTEHDPQVGLFCKLKKDFEATSVLRSYVVDPEYQGHGFGRGLVSHWIEAASQEGRKNQITEVVSENYRSLGIFMSFGFRKITEAVHPYDNSNVTLLMRDKNSRNSEQDLFKL